MKLYKFDILKELKTQKDIDLFVAASIEEAKNDSDPSILADCLAVAARAQDNISKVTAAAGVNRSGFYRSFRRGGDPRLSTFAKVANALGYRVTVAPI
ncbi:MAG: putative addiction module antidote protein [Proteobacteria bacterium]|nr:putative addiction module antidote protein [Pseudomonadota bacterium]